MPVVEPTTEKGRTTRARIIQAAAALVAERGAAAMSLDEVGARAHASRSQLYHYFEDRDDLIRVVMKPRPTGSSPPRTNSSATSTTGAASTAGSPRSRRSSASVTRAAAARSGHSSGSSPSATRSPAPHWLTGSTGGNSISASLSNGCGRADPSLRTLTLDSWRPQRWPCSRAACSSLKSAVIPISYGPRCTPRDHSSGRRPAR